MFLKRLSFGSKECTKELKLECANFLGQTSLISDPLIVSKFHNETHNPKGQENKIYTVVKGREAFTPASNLGYLAPPGQFFMGAKLFIGTPWIGNEGVLKKILVWAM